jgi:hypothetical protein
MSTRHIKEQGEPIHCLIKMEIGAGLRRPRELLKQEARDLIVFSVTPGPHRRISHSNICEVDENVYASWVLLQISIGSEVSRFTLFLLKIASGSFAASSYPRPLSASCRLSRLGH